MKNSFGGIKVGVGIWNALEDATFTPTANQGLAVLVAVPASPGVITLQLPAEPTDGDFVEWSDPLGLNGSGYSLHVVGQNGQKINNASDFVSTAANTSGRVLFCDDLDMWVIIYAH